MHDKLEEALRSLDERTRRGRIERIVWLSEHEKIPSVLMGRTETLYILREARQVFIGGHFAAALILAVAVIEHALVEELQLRGLIKDSPPLSKALQTAKDNSVLPTHWFPDLWQLVYLRNPLTHLTDAKHKHALGARTRSKNANPNVLLEKDARTAIEYMYQVFRATLHEVG